MSEEAEWFSRGTETHDEALDNDNPQGFSGDGGGFDIRQTNRYWIHPDDIGDAQKVFFVDEPTNAFNTVIHKFAIGGKWGNWLPCSVRNGNMYDRCPLCERSNRDGQASPPLKRGHVTIVDITGWTPDDGDHRMFVNILPISPNLMSVFKHEKAKQGTLVGSIWDVIRTGNQKPSVGDNWSYADEMEVDTFLERNIDKLRDSLQAFPEDWGFYEGDGDDRTYNLKPFPYKPILKPMSPDEMEEYLAEKGAPVSSGGGSSSSGSNGSSGGGAEFDNTDDEEVMY